MNAGQAIASAAPLEAGHGRVLARVFREGDRVVAEVEDSGPGLDASDLERVFEAFFTTKPAAEGTGLGLSVSRAIVRDLGGDLRALPQKGHLGGAIFRVELPAAEPGSVGPPRGQG